MADIRTTTTLPDAETIVEAPLSPTHVAVRREDYTPPDWLVPEIALRFTLGIDKTRVQSKLSVERNPDAQTDTNVLRLNGAELAPVGVWIDGELSDT
jgi:aminopeptidase N